MLAIQTGSRMRSRRSASRTSRPVPANRSVAVALLTGTPPPGVVARGRGRSRRHRHRRDRPRPRATTPGGGVPVRSATATDLFAGTGRLVRLALRRDRILLPVWIASISGLAGAVVASYAATLPSEAERAVTAAFGAANPMARVFDGPASGTTLGAMSMVEAYKILAILTALMSAQAIVRHTRQDEETGRAELLGSARPVSSSWRVCRTIAWALIRAVRMARILYASTIAMAPSVVPDAGPSNTLAIGLAAPNAAVTARSASLGNVAA